MEKESSMPPNNIVRAEANNLIEIRTTFPSKEEAVDCGTQLVQSKLAACIHVEGPVTSIFSWQGRIETVEEFTCCCKTLTTKLDACQTKIKDIHPYETPQIVFVQCAASSDYIAWMQESIQTHRKSHE